jgi:hypothetical protein
MLRKLMLVISISLTFLVLFSLSMPTETLGKMTSQKLFLKQVAPSSPVPLTSDMGYCLIQSDSMTEQVIYFPNLFADDGFVLYVDPEKCGLPDPYPFKITDVHFCINGWNGYPQPVWPVEIQVSIRDLNGGVKCNGPGNLLCSQTFTIPIDSSYDSLQRPMNLTIDSLCVTSNPFFLVIKYTGGTSPLYPSLLLTDESDPPDSCNAWALRHEDGLFHEWYTFWASPVPGYPIMRTTGYTNTSAVEDEEETGITPRDFKLHQSYPNPFNPQTEIVFGLPKAGFVTLKVYNILGQEVTTLVEKNMPAGEYRVTWNGTDKSGRTVASGVYFYRMQSGDFAQTKRMLLIK